MAMPPTLSTKRQSVTVTSPPKRPALTESLNVFLVKMPPIERAPRKLFVNRQFEIWDPGLRSRIPDGNMIIPSRQAQRFFC